MAKRPTSRSKDPGAAAPAAPKPKRARGVTALPATTPPSSPDATASAAATAEKKSEPSVDDIRRRAYERYLERGGRHGQHFDDWVEAEKELRSKK
jgi:hypothetical protein